MRTVLGVLSADGQRTANDATVGGVAEEQEQLKQVPHRPMTGRVECVYTPYGTHTPDAPRVIIASSLSDEEKRKALAARRYAPDYRAVYSIAERIIDLASPIVGGSN